MIKNLVIEKLAIKNVVIERRRLKMWWPKVSDQKHGHRKLWQPKAMAIKMCGNQNLWWPTSCGD
jgi:hypothetical protein